MILAAGLGTRLRPLTDYKPKALVEVAGRTLLEITLSRLRSFGIQDVIINVHHFAPMVVDYLRVRDNFGMHIEISHEEELLLDTGGGLKKAAWFFLRGNDNNPFLLHNVDVISDIDFAKMLEQHRRSGALATLAVQERTSSRQLLFDEQGTLCGRRRGKDSADEIALPAKQLHAFAFAGIHVISPRLLPLITEDGVFSIIDTYLRLAASGENLKAFRADDYAWRDLGKLQDLQQAETKFKKAYLS